MFKLKLISIAISIIFICSCSGPKYKVDEPYNPTNLGELHKGFFDTEIVPDISLTNKNEITIITTGHLYPLLNHPLAYNAMVDSINNQKPDYIFLLGDLVRDNTDKEWDSVFSKFNGIESKLYFAPGNHDLNYHYERWNGSNEHQFEAEMNYVNEVGYRYKVLQDNFANYVFINPNDSINRVLSYLEIVKPKLDTTKLMLLISSQSLWHNKHQIPGDNSSWVCKAFTRDEILPNVEYYDYLIHGDWGGKFYQGFWPKSDGRFNVLAVGNRKPNDPLFITRIVISDNSFVASPIDIEIPKESTWFDK